MFPGRPNCGGGGMNTDTVYANLQHFRSKQLEYLPSSGTAAPGNILSEFGTSPVGVMSK
jgi:hypothetical protein